MAWHLLILYKVKRRWSDVSYVTFCVISGTVETIVRGLLMPGGCIETNHCSS